MEDTRVQDYLVEFIAYCKQDNSGKESCGVVVAGKFYPCENISVDKDNFIISPTDLLKIPSGDIEFICHSHLTGSARPSIADIYNCNKGSIDWIIYSTTSNDIEYLNPKQYSIPLLGREYAFNATDCWAIVQDIYEAELNIKLGRPLILDEYWYKNSNVNIFEDHASINGFIQIKEPILQKYDILLFKSGSTQVPNHSGVMYEGNTFIHHLAHRLSTNEVFGGYWNKCLHAVYRYKDLI